MSITDRQLWDWTQPTPAWPLTASGTAARLCAMLHQIPGRVTALTVGIDRDQTPQQRNALRDALQTSLELPVTVVSDSELLVAAAGLTTGIAVHISTAVIEVHDQRRGTTAHPSIRTAIPPNPQAIVDTIAKLAQHDGHPIDDIILACEPFHHTPADWPAILQQLTSRFPHARLTLLNAPPVAGAITLATRLYKATRRSRCHR